MKRILVIAFALALASPAFAQQALNTHNSTSGVRKTFDSEQITVAATAIGFTAAKIAPASGPSFNLGRASYALCINQTAEIRILSSGTTPTASLGLPIAIGQSFQLFGYDDIAAFRAIRTGSVSAVIDCQYSRIP